MYTISFVIVPPGLLPVSLMRKWLIFAICSITQDQVILTGESIPKGTRVVVAKGDLQGLRGELVRYNNKYHILVRIDMFGSAMVTIPASYVRKEK